MLEHCIKVPQLYKQSSKICKAVNEEGQSVKSLVYACKRALISRVHILVTKTLDHYNDCNKVIEETDILNKEKFDPWLARVLITELIWGKGSLGGEAKPIKVINTYATELKECAAKHNFSAESSKSKIQVPRYVRVNTVLCSLEDAISGLRKEGWKFIATREKNYDVFLMKVKNLAEDEFMLDMHVDNLLIFPPGTSFVRHYAVEQGEVILQDKSSCLPVQFLKPTPGSTCLDMCAAPGNKTSHIASLMENTGKIYAIERNRNRFSEMCNLVQQRGVTCVEPICKDATSVTSLEVPGVEYILVDPSCSGSGIVSRINTGYQNNVDEEDRLYALSTFQKLLLKHALTAFPDAKRVVYSTCSLNKQENEVVVQSAISESQDFKLVACKDLLGKEWKNFGDYKKTGKYCLYAKPDMDLTTGFFIAVFERLKDGERNPFYNTPESDLVDEDNQLKNKKMKRTIKEEDEESQSGMNGETKEIVDQVTKPKKKQKKRKRSE